MAVVNTKSTAVSNFDSTQPRVLNPSHLHAGILRISRGLVEVAAGDDDGSVYRMVRLPSNAVVDKLEVLNDAITAGTDYQLGVYQTAVNGGAVVTSDLFGSVIDMSSARTLPLDAMFEALGIEKVEYRLWELLGLSSDPQRDYDICFTGTTVGSGAGTLVLRVEWTV